MKRLCEQERVINDQLSVQLQQCLKSEQELKDMNERLKKENLELGNRVKALEEDVFEREQLRQMFAKALDGMFKK